MTALVSAPKRSTTGTDDRASDAPPRYRVLLLSENAPVPADVRVWNEARTLTDAGYEVVIVCAALGDEDDVSVKPFEILDGIEIHRYPLKPAERGAAGYLREVFAGASACAPTDPQAGLRAPLRRGSRLQPARSVVARCTAAAAPWDSVHLRSSRSRSRALPDPVRRAPPHDACDDAPRGSDSRSRSRTW